MLSSPAAQTAFAVVFGGIAALAFADGDPGRGTAALAYAAATGAMLWRKPARGTREHSALATVQGVAALALLFLIVSDWVSA